MKRVPSVLNPGTMVPMPEQDDLRVVLTKIIGKEREVSVDLPDAISRGKLLPSPRAGGNTWKQWQAAAAAAGLQISRERDWATVIVIRRTAANQRSAV